MSNLRKSAERRCYDAQLGRRIERLRKGRKMPLAKLAAAVDVTPNCLYFYETGSVSCPVFVLARLASALGVSVSVLMPNP